MIKETDERFYIKESTLEKAGNGLFAKTKLRKNDYLEIIGAEVEVGSVADKCTEFSDNYKFASGLVIEDGKYNFTRKIIPCGYGGIVNHTKDPELQNVNLGYTPNTPRNDHAYGVIYKFSRDIEPDEELLGDYGDYWNKIFKWAEEKNNKIDSDWETVLEMNLYSLGDLLKQVPLNAKN